MIRKLPGSEVLAITLLSWQAASYVFMWIALLGDRSLYGMDFVAFYAAGRMAAAGQYHQLYDLDAQRASQGAIVGTDTFRGGTLLFAHPPYLTPLLARVSNVDFVASYIRWSALRVLVMLVCAEMIRRWLRAFGWEARPALLGALSCMCFFPFFLGLLGGQDTAFVMFGLLLWMFSLLNLQEGRAGIGLAIASLSPTIAGALSLPLFASRRGAGLWLFLGLGFLAGYSYMLIGGQGIRDFLSLLALSSQSDSYGLNPIAMYNLLGLLLRSFPGLALTTARAITWVSAIVSITILVCLWWGRRRGLRAEHIGIAVVFSLFTAPHLQVHSVSFLLLPLLTSMTILWQRGHRAAAVLVVPILSTVMLLAALLSLPWNTTITYSLMSVLVLGQSWNLKRDGHTPRTDAR